MRRPISLLIVAAAVLAIPTAQAVSAPPVSLAVSALQVRYGEPVTLAGRLSSHQPGVTVGVFARAFTASGFAEIASVTTGAGGRWSYEAKPSIATTYQSRSGGDRSTIRLVGVRPAVSLDRLRNGRLLVDVEPAQAFHGKKVKIQRRIDGAWRTLAQVRLNRSSRALVPAAIVPLGRSMLRATMSVNQAGPGYLGGFSAPLVLPARWVSLSISPSEIVYGQPVMLSGRVSTLRAGTALTILARAAAKPEFQPMVMVASGTGGRWSMQTKPLMGTAYQARFARSASRALGVGVHPSVRVRVISGARVWTHIGAAHSLAGRFVQMQQLVEGQWHTIAKLPLDGRSTAIFPATMLPGGASTLRVVMSVNQAGTGYLGAFGRPFIYQR
jgi:hypothetical protein